MEYYVQNENVIQFHNFPRFGHTNRLASIAVNETKHDYTGGVTSFIIFLVSFFAIWIWTLSLLKLNCLGGIDRFGWAAGGGVIDVVALRDRGVRRWQRLRIIQRNWRIQSMFAVACFALITFSFVLTNQGFTPFIESLEDVRIVTSQLQTRARHGMHLAHLLSTHMKRLQPYLNIDVVAMCPNYENTQLNSDYSLAITGEEIRNAAQELDYFVSNDIDTLMRGIDKVADTANSVDESIVKAEENDWIIRLFLVVVNVLNLFLFLGVVLTRHKIHSEYYQGVLAIIFVPAFSLTMLFSVFLLCLVSAIAMVNADFCSGGPSPGSPTGTLLELVASTRYQRAEFLRRIVQYYTDNQCTGVNPLGFLQDLEIALVEASGRVADFSHLFQRIDFALLEQECGADLQLLNNTFYSMEPVLSDITTTMERLNDVTKCDEIRPVLEYISHGPICNETIDSLTWMYYTALVIALSTMIMLTTRAALYNVVLPAPKKKRREKEFRQYKRFMQGHGFDTTDWQLDPPKKKADDLVLKTETFDTEESDSTMRITPEPRDDSSIDIFNDEPPAEKLLESVALETLSEEREQTEDDDEKSAESVDSDDSSLNPPASVMSQMAWSFTSSVSSAIKRVVRVRTYSPAIEMSFETVENASRQRSLRTPSKAPSPMLRRLEGGVDDDSSELDDQERTPLSPSLQPPAPQKSQKYMRRTRGSSNLLA